MAWIPRLRSTGRFPLLLDELLDSRGDGRATREAADRLGSAGWRGAGAHPVRGTDAARVAGQTMWCVAASAGVLLADEPIAALDFAGQEDAAACWPGCRSRCSWRPDRAEVVALHPGGQ